jgi:hypothetical protein
VVSEAAGTSSKPYLKWVLCGVVGSHRIFLGDTDEIAMTWMLQVDRKAWKARRSTRGAVAWDGQSLVSDVARGLKGLYYGS